MTDETIVAIYDAAAQANAAIRELEAADVPASAITREPKITSGTVTTAAAGRREPGFWSSLFGGEPDHGSAVYERSVEGGSHVVSVRVPETQAAEVIQILERHNPVDVNERGANYGASADAAAKGGAVGSDRGAAAGTALDGGEERLRLAEEQLQVGKRAVNRGTTRVHRFVSETPVEETVSLRSERVSVDRRPFVGDAPVTDADFSERTIEATEMDEEAVVAKTARVKEEVVIRKDVAERAETVRDTVRREDVEIVKDSDVRMERGPGSLAASRP